MDIVRKHKAITFDIEKKILDQLASRLFRFFTADQLTLIGFLAMVLSAFSYYYATYDLAFLHLANFGIFLNWFGDSLDGRVARLRNESRPKYGHYLDHLVDSISLVIICTGIAFSGLARPAIWLIVLILYLLFFIHTFLKANVTGVFELSISRMGPTEARILVVLVNLVIRYTGNPVLFTKPFRFNMTEVFGLAAMVLFSIFYAKAVSSTLWGKNKIREDS